MTYRAPPIIEAPANPRIARLRDRLANWGGWCRGQTSVAPDGYGAGLNEYDSGDPMVRDEGWGVPAPPADITIPVNAVDARQMEDTIHSMRYTKPGYVWTLTQCYVRESHVDAEARVRAEIYLLNVLDKRRTVLSNVVSGGSVMSFAIPSPA